MAVGGVPVGGVTVPSHTLQQDLPVRYSTASPAAIVPVSSAEPCHKGGVSCTLLVGCFSSPDLVCR